MDGTGILYVATKFLNTCSRKRNNGGINSERQYYNTTSWSHSSGSWAAMSQGIWLVSLVPVDMKCSTLWAANFTG